MEQATTTTTNPSVGLGTAGLETQVGNQPTTVSGVAAASGGVAAGNLIEPDIDEELFNFSSDDTPLMNLMLKAKTVNVTSAEVDHYSIDEPAAMVTVASVTGQKITLVNADKMKVHAYDTLSVDGVYGYIYKNGANEKINRPLMLFVTKVDDDTSFTVKALNGVKSAETDEYGDLPTSSSPAVSNTNYIKAGDKIIILGNALYETQKIVDPDTVLPKPERLFLQKRGMNSVVSDYFDSQRKRIPFASATIAEAEIRNFKVKGNRSLWISQPSKFRVKSREAGDMQYVYTTTGVRWQFKRELEHSGAWTYEDFVALANLFYTGEDVPESCLALCGKHFMQNLQNIDWSKHPEVKIDVKKKDKLGWKVTSITTIFGDFEFKREPTLDRLGYSKCAGFFGENRLVHYKRTAEKSFSEKVEGEEATRKGMLVWDALGLKGSCHMWVDGNGDETAPDATEYTLYNSDTEPVSPTDGVVYIFLQDVSLSAIVGKSPAYSVKSGEMFKYTTADGWSKFADTTIAAS